MHLIKRHRLFTLSLPPSVCICSYYSSKWALLLSFYTVCSISFNFTHAHKVRVTITTQLEILCVCVCVWQVVRMISFSTQKLEQVLARSARCGFISYLCDRENAGGWNETKDTQCTVENILGSILRASTTRWKWEQFDVFATINLWQSQIANFDSSVSNTRTLSIIVWNILATRCKHLNRMVGERETTRCEVDAEGKRPHAPPIARGFPWHRKIECYCME